jgi:uncharacterized protein (TIGR02996 family)
MTDRDALLRAIAANPDDDTPRLIYADLLDELGGYANTARAQFIRLQIETYHGPGDTDRARFDRKLAEIDMMGVRYGPQWLAELPTGVLATYRTGVTSHAFKRGFIEDACLYFNSFTGGGFGFLACNPIVTLFVHAGKFYELTAFLGGADLARIRALQFHSCELQDTHLHEIGRSSPFHSLQKLDLGVCRVSDRGLTALAQAAELPHLSSLRLDCRGKGLTDNGIVALLTSSRLPKLRELHLGYHRSQFWQRTNLQARFPDVCIGP